MKKLLSVTLVTCLLSLNVSCGNNSNEVSERTSFETERPCEAFLNDEQKNQVFNAAHKGVCYLGIQSLENSDVAENYVDLGLFNDPELGEVQLIGKDGIGAALVDDEMAILLSSDNEIVPFILAVVAIDAGLIATMWATGISQM